MLKISFRLKLLPITKFKIPIHLDMADQLGLALHTVLFSQRGMGHVSLLGLGMAVAHEREL